MCVALPGRVTWIGATDAISIPARVDIGDREVAVDLAMTPEAGVGDYVVTHSGLAIRIVSHREAHEVRGSLGVDP